MREVDRRAKRDIDASMSDQAPKLDAEWVKGARRGRDVLPEEVRANFKRPTGRPKSDNPKQHVSLRLDPDVLAHYKDQGAGWQGKVNDVLREAMERA